MLTLASTCPFTFICCEMCVWVRVLDHHCNAYFNEYHCPCYNHAWCQLQCQLHSKCNVGPNLLLCFIDVITENYRFNFLSWHIIYHIYICIQNIFKACEYPANGNGTRFPKARERTPRLQSLCQRERNSINLYYTDGQCTT